MSRSYGQKNIPHRYRKGPDGGVRKSTLWADRSKTKREIDKMPISLEDFPTEDDYASSK